MRLPFYIAKRYFFSRKSTNVINLISIISLLGIAFGTAALIIVLSVFNGFEQMSRSMLNAFNPDIKVLPENGSFFDKSNVIKILSENHDIEAFSFTLQDNALMEYEDRQYIGYVKGVDDNFSKVTGIDSMILYGTFSLHYKGRPMAVVGAGIANNLGIQLNFLGSIKIWLPRPDAKISFDLSQMFVRTHIFPSGIFAVHQDFDTKYIFVPLEFLQSSLGLDTNLVSAAEIKIKKGKDEHEVEQVLQNELVANFDVRNRYEQEEMFYKIVRSERLAVILILAFIIIIASFNVIATISMLIIDKQKDIEILNFLGANEFMIKRIFLNQGFIINGVGVVIGLILGIGLVLVQKYFGILEFPSTASFSYLYYPVVLKLTDIAITLFIVLSIGYLASVLPVNFFIKKYFRNG